MSIALETIYDPAEAPPVARRRFGAESVVEMRQAVDHALLGTEWEDFQVAQTALDVTIDDCLTTSSAADPSALQCAEWRNSGEPRALAGLYSQSFGSRRTMADHRQAARDRFLAIEPHGIDTLVGVYAISTAGAPVANAGTATSVRESIWTAIGRCEEAHALSSEAVFYEGERTILMSIEQANAISTDLVTNGGVLRTVLGSKVGVIAGGSLGGDIVVSSPIVVTRGELDVDVATGALAVNDTSILAQRPYVIGASLVRRISPQAIA